MSIPRIANALSLIDEELVCCAIDYCPKPREAFRFSWKQAIALAACLCIAVIASLWPHSKPVENPGVDIEPCVHLSLQEAQSDPVFGVYFPTIIPEGFELESTVKIYDAAVMQAVFINENDNGVFTVEIRPKNRDENITTNTVLYWSESAHPESSYIYLDCGDYVINYSSDNDLKKIEGFEEMIYSSKYFENE